MTNLARYLQAIVQRGNNRLLTIPPIGYGAVLDHDFAADDTVVYTASASYVDLANTTVGVTVPVRAVLLLDGIATISHSVAGKYSLVIIADSGDNQLGYPLFAQAPVANNWIPLTVNAPPQVVEPGTYSYKLRWLTEAANVACYLKTLRCVAFEYDG